MIGRMGVSTRAALAEIGGNKTHGVADRLEEEEAVEARDAAPAGYLRYACTEDGAGDGEEGKQ